LILGVSTEGADGTNSDSLVGPENVFRGHELHGLAEPTIAHAAIGEKQDIAQDWLFALALVQFCGNDYGCLTPRQIDLFDALDFRSFDQPRRFHSRYEIDCHWNIAAE
jgi:hypothetical protein